MDSDTPLLQIAEDVTKAKEELDRAEIGVNYYQRVLDEAKARQADKQQAFDTAMEALKKAGGGV